MVLFNLSQPFRQPPIVAVLRLGDRSFYPAGAPSVRIRFAEEKDAVVMAVHDPDLVLTARRNQPAR